MNVCDICSSSLCRSLYFVEPSISALLYFRGFIVVSLLVLVLVLIVLVLVLVFLLVIVLVF